MPASGLKLKTIAAVTVATSGTPVALCASTQWVYSATIQSLSSNTGTQYIGDSTVTSSNGLQFGAGDIIEVDAPASARSTDQFDLSKVYVDSSTNGAAFRVVAWIRE